MAELPASRRERRTWPGASEETLGFMSETARVTLDKDGKVTVYTGSSPHGQGEETTFAQLASEELGVPLENVTVVWGDTALIPRGIGTFGSRSAATGGSAVVDASRKLKAQLIARASEALGVDAKSLDDARRRLRESLAAGRSAGDTERCHGQDSTPTRSPRARCSR